VSSWASSAGLCQPLPSAQGGKTQRQAAETLQLHRLPANEDTRSQPGKSAGVRGITWRRDVFLAAVAAALFRAAAPLAARLASLTPLRGPGFTPGLPSWDRWPAEDGRRREPTVAGLAGDPPECALAVPPAAAWYRAPAQ